MLKTAVRWSAIAIGVAFAIGVLVELYFFAMTGWYAHHDPGSTAFIRERMNELRARDPSAQPMQHWVPYANVADDLKRAVVTSEDARFTEHEGVDWDAVSKAYENNERLAAGKGRRRARIKGGSTITQQLAKNLFLSGERSYLRKGQELVIAYMIEFWMTKRRILEIYLNVVEWGDGVFGADAAAHHYFGVSADRLTAAQAAELAVMLPNPRYYDAHRGSPWLASRSAVIRRWMPDADLP